MTNHAAVHTPYVEWASVVGSIDVLFLPDWRNGNPYQLLLAQGIESAGLRVGFENYPDCELPLLAVVKGRPSIRVIHLHWIGPYLARVFWSGSALKARIRTFLLLLDVLLVRLRGVRVVWTVHNFVSHESPDEGREVFARRWLSLAVSRLVFHSVTGRREVERLLSCRLSGRSEVIPHGHYIGLYPPDPGRMVELRQRFRVKSDERVILFFGGIRQYKGINQLLQAFRELPDLRLRLVVAGRPFDATLAQEIEAATEQDERIVAYLGYIPERDVNPLYSIAHVAAVPFERTLTSGSVILAISLGKALLLPETAKVIGLDDTRGTVFFQDQRGLQDALRMLADLDLEAMGRLNRAQAALLDWSSIGRKTASAYRICPRRAGARSPQAAK